MPVPETLQLFVAVEWHSVDWSSLWISIACLVLALVLLILEIFVVSFGLLFLCSIAAAGAAIYYAFVANDLAGWIITGTAPLLGAILARWGFARVRSSKHLVIRDEIASEAGYHHLLDELGIGIDSVGVMVTPAHPSGRARFGSGECDVQTREGSLERGDHIVIREIDGPNVFVAHIHNDEPDQ